MTTIASEPTGNNDFRTRPEPGAALPAPILTQATLDRRSELAAELNARDTACSWELVAVTVGPAGASSVAGAQGIAPGA